MTGRLFTPTAPVVEVPGPTGSPAFPSFNTDANGPIPDGYIVALGSVTAGLISSVAPGADALLLGVIQGDSQAVYQQEDTSIQGVFGADNVATGLLPASAGQIPVALFQKNPVAINLPQTTGWITGGTHQANVGTEVGINFNATYGVYYADDQESNKVAYITGLVAGSANFINNGQTVQWTGAGSEGDLGVRVYIVFIPSTLAVYGSL